MIKKKVKKIRHGNNESRGNWSADVTRHSNALDLEEGIFTWQDPVKIARSLQQSAEQSKRRKSSPFRSAMSMLVFYINRSGRNLDDAQRSVLEQTKVELRKLYSRKPRKTGR